MTIVEEFVPIILVSAVCLSPAHVRILGFPSLLGEAKRGSPAVGGCSQTSERDGGSLNSEAACEGLFYPQPL